MQYIALNSPFESVCLLTINPYTVISMELLVYASHNTYQRQQPTIVKTQIIIEQYQLAKVLFYY